MREWTEISLQSLWRKRNHSSESEWLVRTNTTSNVLILLYLFIKWGGEISIKTIFHLVSFVPIKMCQPLTHCWTAASPIFLLPSCCLISTLLKAVACKTWLGFVAACPKTFLYSYSAKNFSWCHYACCCVSLTYPQAFVSASKNSVFSPSLIVLC